MTRQARVLEVGEVLRAIGEPCWCVYIGGAFEEGEWVACPAHPSRCTAIMLYRDGQPEMECGMPLPAGETRCLDHEIRRKLKEVS